MKGHELTIKGAWEITLEPFADERGKFFESFKLNSLEKIIGRQFYIKQSNTSISKRGTIRGIHYAQKMPSQAKYIQCQNGSILDFIVDLRVGSPTFAQHLSIKLESDIPKAIFIEEGLAHAFIALEEKTIVTYLVNQYFNLANEYGVHPLDKDLAIKWGDFDYTISEKDLKAKTVSEMKEMNLLPIYDECSQFIKNLKSTNYS